MATAVPEIDFDGIGDAERHATLALGGVLVAMGFAGLMDLLYVDLATVSEVAGLFGVPFWLGITLIVAGVLGLLLTKHGDNASTFNALTARLVFPAMILLAITDWSIGVGTAWALGIGLLALTAAALVIALGTILLWGHPLALLFPLVGVLAVLDWMGAVTAAVPGASVTGPTLGLIIGLGIGVGLIGVAGHRRGPPRASA